jgi:isopentenyl-diphosphate delta-isomerase
VLPSYRYTTPPYNGIIENEFCPVFVAYIDEEPKPNPDEVETWQWMAWPDYVKMLQGESHNMSYWAKDQYEQLKTLAPFVRLS